MYNNLARASLQIFETHRWLWWNVIVFLLIQLFVLCLIVIVKLLFVWLSQIVASLSLKVKFKMVCKCLPGFACNTFILFTYCLMEYSGGLILAWNHVPVFEVWGAFSQNLIWGRWVLTGMKESKFCLSTWHVFWANYCKKTLKFGHNCKGASVKGILDG